MRLSRVHRATRRHRRNNRSVRALLDSARLRQLHTFRVPPNETTAWVHRTYSHATFGRFAPGTFMNDVAALYSRTRPRRLAPLHCAVYTKLIPCRFAAHRVVFANHITADRVRTSGCFMDGETASLSRTGTDAHARLLSHCNTIFAPCDKATVWILDTDRRATRNVFAARRFARFEAISSRAAHFSSGTIDQRSNNAPRVPGGLTAIGIVRAYTGTAICLFTSARIMFFEAAFCRRASAFAVAVQQRGFDAGRVPRLYATGRLVCTDDRAAGTIVASECPMRRKAITCGWASRWKIANLKRQGCTGFTPCIFATRTLEQADLLAAVSFMTANRCVAQEAGFSARAYCRHFTFYARNDSTCFVPL